MSHHIHLDFSRTMPVTRSRRSFRLPRIDQQLENSGGGRSGTVLKPTAPKLSPKFAGASPTSSSQRKSLFTRQRHVQEEFAYRPKTKKADKVRSANADLDMDVLHSSVWCHAVRQMFHAEAVARKLCVANETIERQRLVREVFGRKQDVLIENEEHGLRLFAAGDYAGAHVYFSRALRQCKRSKIILGRRAVCNWRLLRFEECVEDCRVILDSGQSMDLEILSLLCRSLLLLKRYQEAQRWYEHAMNEMNHLSEDPFYVKWRLECDAIPALQKFCLFAEQRRIKESLFMLDAAKALIDDSPLVVLEAQMLLHVDPESARLRLLAYVPTITLNSPTNVATSMDEKMLCRHVREHYLQAAVLLAQANAYCGVQYLVVAAALVKTCLAINPSFNSAIVLGHYIISTEEILSRVEALFNSKRYADALPLLDEGLQLDTSNCIMCSTLYSLKAEANTQLGRMLKALGDCNRAVELNPSNAHIFVQRAKVLEKTNRLAEAARDRLSAVKLDPSYRTILHGDEEQYRESPLPSRSSNNLRNSRAERNQRSRTHWWKREEFCSNANDSRTPSPVLPTVISLSLYDALEVQKGATVDEVRTQFKKLILLCHPDRVIAETPEKQRAALERFKLISHAHEVLSDPMRKNLYDISLGIIHQDGLCR